MPHSLRSLGDAGQRAIAEEDEIRHPPPQPASHACGGRFRRAAGTARPRRRELSESSRGLEHSRYGIRLGCVRPKRRPGLRSKAPRAGRVSFSPPPPRRLRRRRWRSRREISGGRRGVHSWGKQGWVSLSALTFTEPCSFVISTSVSARLKAARPPKRPMAVTGSAAVRSSSAGARRALRGGGHRDGTASRKLATSHR